MSEGHKLFSLISSISNHETLISSTNIFVFLANMNSFSYFSWLLIEGNHNAGILVVKTFFNIVITNFFDGLSDNLLIRHQRVSRADFTENHHESVLAGRLTSNLGIRIFCQACIKDRVRNVVAKLIRMSNRNRLRWEEEVILR